MQTNGQVRREFVRFGDLFRLIADKAQVEVPPPEVLMFPRLSDETRMAHALKVTNAFACFQVELNWYQDRVREIIEDFHPEEARDLIDAMVADLPETINALDDATFQSIERLEDDFSRPIEEPR